jgi:endonuclease/exonuclease/phosphatase family metal-dependent hydrolase
MTKDPRRRSACRAAALALVWWCCPVATQAASPDNCRTAVSASGEASEQAVRWVLPDSARERRALDGWCQAVGPAVVVSGVPTDPATKANELVVVTWNVHVGAGDVARLVTELRAGSLTGGQPVEHFVLLLQETYRRGSLVPADARGTTHVPRSIVPRRTGSPVMDIVDLSNELGLALFYAPSMRNGPSRRTDEDRGNAILSTEPLTELSVIELPFERQRRVALEATIQSRHADGAPWTLRITNAQLENLGGLRRVGILSVATRLKQARYLLRLMTPSEHGVLGGDLNTWFGFREPAYHALARAFSRDAGRDRRPTFGRLMRLDHLLFQIPETWNTDTVRLDPLGSDHHPLLARIRMPPERSSAAPPH